MNSQAWYDEHIESCGGCDICWDCYAQCEYCGEDLTEAEAIETVEHGRTIIICKECE